MDLLFNLDDGRLVRAGLYEYLIREINFEFYLLMVIDYLMIRGENLMLLDNRRDIMFFDLMMNLEVD